MPDNTEAASIRANKIRKCIKLLTETTSNYDSTSGTMRGTVDYERALPHARRLLLLLGGPLAGELAPEPTAAADDSPFNLTPAELRRIADILETNGDQRGFDFWSALAAMESEDLDSLADNPASVKPAEDPLRKLLADWLNGELTRANVLGSGRRWQAVVDDAKARHETFGIPWDDSFVPDYVREVLAMGDGQPAAEDAPLRFQWWDADENEWVDVRTLDGETLEAWRQGAIEAGNEGLLDDIQEIMQDPGVWPRKKQ